MHPNSLKLFEIHARPLFARGMRVLEVAPESIPSALQNAVGDSSIQWDGINLVPDDKNYVIPTDSRTILTTRAYEYPIADDTYDVVVSANVFEHVPMPWKWMKELARVCKPGGRVITLAPLNWGYHAEPIDCWRPYPEGMKAVYEDAGLQPDVALFDSTDGLSRRANVAGLKYIVKRVINWPVKGEPWRAWDTICIGTKPLRVQTPMGGRAATSASASGTPGAR